MISGSHSSIQRLSDRFDSMCRQEQLPEDWVQLKREVGLLLLGKEPDLHLIQALKQSYDKASSSTERGYVRATPSLVSDLTQALETLQVELQVPHDAPEPHALAREIEKILDLLNGRPDHAYIWLDAAFIGFAHFLGYVAGTAVQRAMEDWFCEGGTLSYEQRLAAESVNRTVQHGVRFLLRDVAMIAVKQHASLKMLVSPKQIHAWMAVVAAIACALDHAGLQVMSVLPPVQKVGPQMSPDRWEDSLQNGVFGSTDFLAWVGIGYASTWLFKAWYAVEKMPWGNLKVKALTHLLQVIVVSLVISGWKYGHEDGLNPNSLCRPGHPSVSLGAYHGYVGLFDLCELGTLWTIIFILGCMGQTEKEPLMNAQPLGHPLGQDHGNERELGAVDQDERHPVNECENCGVENPGSSGGNNPERSISRSLSADEEVPQDAGLTPTMKQSLATQPK